MAPGACVLVLRGRVTQDRNKGSGRPREANRMVVSAHGERGEWGGIYIIDL